MAAQSEFFENFLNIVDFVLFGLETNFLGWNGIILKIHLSIAHLYFYLSIRNENNVVTLQMEGKCVVTLN